MKAELAPALGGALMALSHEGRDLLRRVASVEAVAADPREAACYPMVPWFSRLAGGLDFAGRHYDLMPTLPICDPDHALHGHGWVRPWTVSARSQDSVACNYDHAPEPGLFPFPFRAEQRFSVNKSAFRIDLSVMNTGGAPMPAGLGLHPFFTRRDKSAIVFNDARTSFAGAVMDDSHEGWNGAARIEDDSPLRIVSNAPILHLYAPPNGSFFCAEPVTHLPGRFGETVLTPGETLKIFLKIETIFSDAEHGE